MTVVSQMPYLIPCPGCGVQVPSHLRYCWGCRAYISAVHKRCSVCGKPVSHGRHRGPQGLAYYCGCGFAATRKEELDDHLREMKLS